MRCVSRTRGFLRVEGGTDPEQAAVIHIGILVLLAGTTLVLLSKPAPLILELLVLSLELLHLRLYVVWVKQ